MLRNRYAIGGAIIVVLILANILSYIISNWGLITVKVNDAPLGTVIKSIERQGWVTIYTDLPLDTKVSMWVDKVPLPEAMESLTANAGGQWKLGFFAAPTSAAVKQEILAFQAGTSSDDTKIYNYPVMLAMLAGTDSEGLPPADPRLQTWVGYHPPATPPPAPANNNADGQAAPADAAPPAPPSPPTNLQDYLRLAAEQADILIMAPGSWSPNVPAPSANISISRAVKNLVSNAHGSVEQAIVLRGRRRAPGGGQRGGGFAGGDTGWSYMEDRLRNAINGLPEDARAGATAQLEQEVKFQKDVQAAAPDQRMEMMRSHFADRMMNQANNWRRSPSKRAQMYQRAVANRQSARGG